MGKSRVVTPLKLARVKAGYFAYEVADLLGQHQGVYSLQENGRVPVPPADRVRLAKIFKTSVEKLFGNDAS